MHSVGLRVGFLASHGGSALAAILDGIREGSVPAAPVVVISNNSGAGALVHARCAGVPAVHISSATHPDAAGLDMAIRSTLQQYGAEVVILSGYMKKVGPRTLERFRGRILNTHPALLPKFGGQGMYGIRVHEAVLAAGETVTGVTIHLVDEEYDHGALLSQREVPVLPGDTPESLQERVKSAEGGLFVQTLADVAIGRLRLGG